MGHSQAEKARSRERILREAAKQIRDKGFESISVGRLMRSVNLTHGGFYGHFASRSDLLAQALDQALQEGAAAAAAGPARPTDYTDMVRRYLSRAHRDARDSGCAIAALASDVARADEGSREVMETRIERFVAKIANAMGKGDEQALFAASAMIGGLLLSRVITDPKRSDQVLRAVRDELANMKEDDDNA